MAALLDFLIANSVVRVTNIIPYVLHKCLESLNSVCISGNMGTRNLPDMYARSPRASGIHIRQIPHAHVTTDM